MPKSPINREEQKQKTTPEMIDNWIKRVDKRIQESGHLRFREPSPNSLNPKPDCMEDMKALLEATMRQNEATMRQNDQILAAITSISLQPLSQMRTHAPTSFMPVHSNQSSVPLASHSNQSSVLLASHSKQSSVLLASHSNQSSVPLTGPSTNASHALLTGQTLLSSTSFSVPKKSYQLLIGNGKTIIYCAEDLRDDCNYRWPDTTPEQYLTNLWGVWDDEDQHWMSVPNTLILLRIGGEPIALKYWRAMWKTARKRFPHALSASWHTRKCLMEELKKYPTVHAFLKKYTQPCGKPSTIRQITDAIKLQGGTS